MRIKKNKPEKGSKRTFLRKVKYIRANWDNEKDIALQSILNANKVEPGVRPLVTDHKI